MGGGLAGTKNAAVECTTPTTLMTAALLDSLHTTHAHAAHLVTPHPIQPPPHPTRPTHPHAHATQNTHRVIDDGEAFRAYVEYFDQLHRPGGQAELHGLCGAYGLPINVLSSNDAGHPRVFSGLVPTAAAAAAALTGKPPITLLDRNNNFDLLHDRSSSPQVRDVTPAEFQRVLEWRFEQKLRTYDSGTRMLHEVRCGPSESGCV